MSENQTPSLEFMSDLAKAAGHVTLEYFRKSQVSYSEKSGHHGIVTEADLSSENLIRSKILEKFPSHSILAEESGLTESAQAQEEGGSERQPIWVIDPLDGTANFSHGNSYYCVSIAFGYRNANECEIHLGAVYQPFGDVLYLAQKGKGAWMNGERIRVSGVSEFRMGAYATGIGSSHGNELRRLLDSIFHIQSECISSAVRLNGAAALDLAHVAAGFFDGFWEPKLNPWDVAAGSLLISEAGGKVTNFKGQPFDPLRDPDLLGGSPKIYEQLLRQVQSVYSG